MDTEPAAGGPGAGDRWCPDCDWPEAYECGRTESTVLLEEPETFDADLLQPTRGGSRGQG